MLAIASQSEPRGLPCPVQTVAAGEDLLHGGRAPFVGQQTPVHCHSARRCRHAHPPTRPHPDGRQRDCIVLEAGAFQTHLQPRQRIAIWPARLGLVARYLKATRLGDLERRAGRRHLPVRAGGPGECPAHARQRRISQTVLAAQTERALEDRHQPELIQIGADGPLQQKRLPGDEMVGGGLRLAAQHKAINHFAVQVLGEAPHGLPVEVHDDEMVGGLRHCCVRFLLHRIEGGAAASTGEMHRCGAFRKGRPDGVRALIVVVVARQDHIDAALDEQRLPRPAIAVDAARRVGAEHRVVEENDLPGGFAGHQVLLQPAALLAIRIEEAVAVQRDQVGVAPVE